MIAFFYFISSILLSILAFSLYCYVQWGNSISNRAAAPANHMTPINQKQVFSVLSPWSAVFRLKKVASSFDMTFLCSWRHPESLSLFTRFSISFNAHSKDHAKTFPGSSNPSRGTALEAKVPFWDHCTNPVLSAVLTLHLVRVVDSSYSTVLPGMAGCWLG